MNGRFDCINGEFYLLKGGKILRGVYFNGNADNTDKADLRGFFHIFIKTIRINPLYPCYPRSCCNTSLIYAITYYL